MIAIYCRVSTMEQGEGHSIDGQLEAVKSAIGDEPYQEYIDIGFSGTVDDRPSLNLMLQDIQIGKIKQVVVYKLDRLFRNTRHFLNMLHEIDKFGVSVRSVTEPIDTGTPTGKYFMQQMSSFAELERNLFVDRASMGRRQRMKKGLHWGQPPYGYDVDDAGRLIINEVEASVVAEIFDHYIQSGSSTIKIAKELNAKGVLTKRGIRWTSTGVGDILRKSCYTGIYEYLDATTECPQIVSAAVYEKARDLARRRIAHKAGGNKKHQYLLKELLFCGSCGSRMSGTSEINYSSYKNRKKTGERYGPYTYLAYRCVGRNLNHRRRREGKPEIKCKMRQVSSDEIEAVVWDQLTAILLDPELLSKTLQQDTHDYSKDLKKLDTKRKNFAVERQNIVTAYRKSLIKEADLAHQLAEIELAEKALETEKESFTNRLSRQDSDALILGSAKELSLLYKDKLMACSFDDKQAILLKMVDKIYLHMDGKVEINLHFFHETIAALHT